VRQVIAGLDVGTTKICCVIADWSPVGNLDIVGVGTSPSRGLRKGVVVNIDSTVESIKHAVAEAEEMAGVEIPSVIAGVAGGHIRGINSRGVVAVSGKHREVSQADIDRALDAARAVNLPQDREIIHVLPQTFLVDDQDGVKEPLGMSGVRLEVEVHLVTGATTSVRNVVRSVNRAGLQVQDLVLEPLASAEAVISTEEKELGIEVTDHTLTIKGERKEAKDIKEKTYRLHERLEKEFERRFSLPVEADLEHVTAKYAKGMLEVHAPKIEQAKPRTVAIARA
jgi:cell division protein FtsA